MARPRPAQHNRCLRRRHGGKRHRAAHVAVE
jgi:hypothetical protein